MTNIVCCGCGAPYEMGAYKTCDCPTNCGFDREDINHETVVSKPRCAWCNAIPTEHNLDGDDLCLACCRKWARAEGLADAESVE